MSATIRAASIAATTTELTGRLLQTGRPRLVTSQPRWTRLNYRRRPVSLDGGAAVGAGVIAGLWPDPRAMGLALSAAAAGGYDDLLAPGRESAADKGIAGHLAALRSGRVSGGAVKVAAIGGAAWWAVGPWSRSTPDRVVRTVAVAGSANLINLLDLRPGRAGKLVVLAALALAHGPRSSVAGAGLGAALAALPGDLGERTMLGDTGANTLGAVLGYRAATASTGLALAAAVLTAAAAVISERVSFSAVIARTSWLRRLDDLGRTT